MVWFYCVWRYRVSVIVLSCFRIHYVLCYRMAIQTCSAVCTVLIFRSWKLNVSVTKAEPWMRVDSHLTWAAFSSAWRKIKHCRKQLGSLSRQHCRGSSVSDPVLFVAVGLNVTLLTRIQQLPNNNHWLSGEVFLSYFREMSVKYLTIGHKCFLPWPFKLIIPSCQAVSNIYILRVTDGTAKWSASKQTNCWLYSIKETQSKVHGPASTWIVLFDIHLLFSVL
jgi:hypothetical protein